MITLHGNQVQLISIYLVNRCNKGPRTLESVVYHGLGDQVPNSCRHSIAFHLT